MKWFIKTLELVNQPATLDSALDLEALPPLQKDPFDRPLVSQVLVEGHIVAIKDRSACQVPVAVIW